jgi:hypothetical protein
VPFWCWPQRRLGRFWAFGSLIGPAAAAFALGWAAAAAAPFLDHRDQLLAGHGVAGS